jgi:hypothetical protein
MKSYKIDDIRLASTSSTAYVELLTTNINVSYVSCQIWWSGVDAFDGSVSLGVKRSSNAPFNKIPTLVFTIDDEDGSGGGSCILTYKNYHGYAVGILVDKGTATAGIISITVLVDE